MADINRNDLGYLGLDFQYRLIHSFMENKEFFKDLHSIVDQNMFTDPNLKTYVGAMKDYYESQEAVPNYDMMRIVLKDMSRSETDRELLLATVDKIQNTPSDSGDYIQKLAEKFFKQQNIVKTANEILRIAGNGDTSQYDRCVELLNDAMARGVHENFGHSVFDDLGETLSNDYRTVIPTGIEKLDIALEGGIGKGELGVIACSTGVGKTSMTTAMASYAATCKTEQNNYSGFKVIQIVFEDREKQIQRKHIGRITGIEAKDLSKPEYIDIVRQRIRDYKDYDMLNNNLRIIRLPNGEVTAVDIKRLIKKMANNGFVADLVIVDYFECLAHTGTSTNEYEKEGRTMRKFEAMVGELNIAMWIPSQGTKDAISQELVTIDKMGGSAKKAQIAHIIVTITRSLEDIANNKATLALMKNRAGKSGRVFSNVYFNNGTCIISTDDTDDCEDMVEYTSKKRKEIDDLTTEIFKKVQEQNKLNKS